MVEGSFDQEWQRNPPQSHVVSDGVRDVRKVAERCRSVDWSGNMKTLFGVVILMVATIEAMQVRVRRRLRCRPA